MDEAPAARSPATKAIGMTTALTDFIRDEFARFIASPRYPCIGARSSLRNGGCRINVYGPMDDADTTRELSRDLADFAVAERSRRFVAFAAVFAEPAPESEQDYEGRLWRQLSALAVADRDSKWDDARSPDPENPQFAFCFRGTPFFLIGMHPESSRMARQFAWPAIVFNPHAQFEQLRAEQRFESMRQTIRARDVALQGSVNPNLADAGERSEARQYSGRAVDDPWTCPFHRPASP